MKCPATVEASKAAAQAALRDLAWAIDGATSAQERLPSSEVEATWSALVQGRWSVVDRFDRDARRFILARPVAPASNDPAALTPRDAQVAALAALGHPYKRIACELGIAMSTVAWYLPRALKKLGLASRSELMQLPDDGDVEACCKAGAGERAGAAELRAPSGLDAVRFHFGDRAFLLLTFPRREVCLDALSPAERAIVAAVLLGKSNAAIAAARGRSPHTIANQLASIYRKLGVRSRLGLGAQCAPAATRRRA